MLIVWLLYVKLSRTFFIIKMKENANKEKDNYHYLNKRISMCSANNYNTTLRTI